MIDNFALALTHGLIVLVFWRLLQSDALDRDPGEGEAGAESESESDGGKAGARQAPPPQRGKLPRA